MAALGAALYIIAAGLSLTLGFMEKPALVSILAASGIGTAGYAFVRFPQMLDIYRRDGLKILYAFFLVCIGYGALCSILYGIGWSVSRAFG